MTAARPERAAPAPQFIGQATAVEQARAVAEVQASVIVAQNVPRALDDVLRRMRESCSQKPLAERAFWRYPRDGKQLTGPSIKLARELKRCYGNFQSGIDELRRDDDKGESEVRAWAWDVETNSRQSRTLIIKHARDLQNGGRRELTTLRDVQEMIANQGARVEREMILALLPEWLIEEATEICRKTLEGIGADKPLAQRIADLIQAFADRYGVTKRQLEDKVGRPAGEWAPPDLANLRVIWTALSRNEVTVDEEFPAARITKAEITGETEPVQPPAAAEPESAPGQQRITRAQSTKLHAVLGKLGVTDREEKLRVVAALLRSAPLQSTNDLTRDEAKVTIDTLESIASREDPQRNLQFIIEAATAADGQADAGEPS